MPTYEFRCPSGHVFEKFYPRISGRRRLPCPTCGKTGVRLISGGTGLVFKGSGFYATDYKRAGEKAEGGEQSATKKDGAPQPAEPKTPESPKKKDSGDK